MKKIFLLICLLAGLTDYASAQIEKGTFTIGGQAFMVFPNEGKLTDNLLFRITPKVGYFALRNLEVGLQLPTSYSKFTREIVGTETITSYMLGIGLYTTYYHPINSKLYVLGSIGAGIGRGNIRRVRSGIAEFKNLNEQSYFNAGVGLAYFISPAVALEGRLEYLGAKEQIKVEDGTLALFPESENAYTRIGLEIGLKVFLRKQPKQ